jgi:hypothetical protein
MQLRPNPLPAPPDRMPYIRVSAGDSVVVLRIPSLHQSAQLASALDRSELVRLAPLLSGRTPLTALVAAGPAILEMMGALIGLAWADPVLQLSTPAPRDLSAGSVRPYGAEVYEELHEAGWPLSRMLAATMVVLRETAAASAIEQEVQELASFFGVPMLTPSDVQPSSTLPGQESPSVVDSTH